MRAVIFSAASLSCPAGMRTDIIHGDLPSRHFEPRVYGVGAWTPHLAFAYDLMAVLKPPLLVELGVDRGESYFAFCQSAVENRIGARFFGIDTWQGDQHAGGYDETTFNQVSEHNQANYPAISSLIRSSFDDALRHFENESIDVLHLDGLHTEEAVRHDLNLWLPKLRPSGILLLHDVRVRSKGFGVWKAWEELQSESRSWTLRMDRGWAYGRNRRPLSAGIFRTTLGAAKRIESRARGILFRSRRHISGEDCPALAGRLHPPDAVRAANHHPGFPFA